MGSPDYPMNGDRGPDNRFSFAARRSGGAGGSHRRSKYRWLSGPASPTSYQFSAGDITLFGVILLMAFAESDWPWPPLESAATETPGEQLSSLEQRTAIIAEQASPKGGGAARAGAAHRSGGTPGHRPRFVTFCCCRRNIACGGTRTRWSGVYPPAGGSGRLSPRAFHQARGTDTH